MSDTRITRLRCEYLVDPLGLDERAPRLSWEIESARRGARQVAWRVRVASSLDQLNRGETDRWDSGRVEGSQTAHIVYGGQPLWSRDTCHWSVEIWDETGAAVRSPAARWTMGLLEKADWLARWIAADPAIITRDPQAVVPTLTEPGTPGVFRRKFTLPAGVKRAMVYASARGLFELRLGGRRIGTDVFAPEWTDYDKRIHYRAYEVTSLLTSGTNTLDATLGDGWWSGYVGWQEHRGRYGSLENSLLVQLEAELADGSWVTIGSDDQWTCHTGPIISSDFMMGEVYDARRERPGWDLVGRAVPCPPPTPGAEGTPRPTADAAWLHAREVPAPVAALVAQRSEPVRVIDDLKPVAVNEVKPGTWIYDLGQNITGWVRLRVNAPAGTRVQLRHGERLSPDGTLYVENLRRARATDTYVCRGSTALTTGGDGVEIYEPHFTFHGFQYVELTATPPPRHK